MNRFAARLLPFALSFFSSLCIMVLELVASRLVGGHVGSSLIVWTSVIGIMLGGICLGNVLGGRLADRIEPVRAIGPLYALGSGLTLGCLWVNAVIGYIPGDQVLPWNLWTVLVVSLDFLIPTTVLGMIGPVVAKMAVEQAKRSGSALGDVYMFGAIGSIVGTFLAGFWLFALAHASVIVTVVAAAYALLAAAMLGETAGLALGLLAAAYLGIGSIEPVVRMLPVAGVRVGSVTINPIALAGHFCALALAVMGAFRLWREPASVEGPEAPLDRPPRWGFTRALGDLIVLSFLASLAFMALEMLAGRLVTRHLGSSVFGWTSVIGVLLGGLSIGNFLGGKIADRVKRENQASWLFLAASILTAFILIAEKPPEWLIRNPIAHYAKGAAAVPLAGGSGAWLSQAITMSGFPWWFRVLFWTTVVFLLPAVAMGTVSPVVAKLAVDRVRHAKRTGAAIGLVYAWGMVGSILGTFLTGFFLIDVLGTKGLILVLATVMALAATYLGTVWHALWAGIPLGLCVIAFLPTPWLEKQGLAWGIREEKGDPNATGNELAHIDESNYYYIKVTNEVDAEGNKRILVLDNLIHGYFILGHPERLDYDYEHIYALVTHRAMMAKANAAHEVDLKQLPLSTLFLGGGSYTFPRFLQHTYPKTTAEVAEIDPSVTRANWTALGLPPKTTIHTTWGDARQFVDKNRKTRKFDIVYGDAFNDFSVPWHLTTREFNQMISDMLTPDGIYMINIIDVYESDATAKQWAKSGRKGTPHDEDQAIARARSMGGFIGSWVETARQTFPHLYVFGTTKVPGNGLRETFVVVASKKPLDLEDLGSRPDDPEFFDDGELFTPKPYPKADMDALKIRSQGIILTDDYAPVENLLAPVAATRGEDD
jgi:spermidine synthase/MFS family permease